MVSMTAKEFCDVLIVDGVTVMVVIAMLIAYFKDGGNEMQEDNARPCSRCRNRKEYTHRGRRYKACDKWECKPDLIDSTIMELFTDHIVQIFAEYGNIR